MAEPGLNDKQKLVGIASITKKIPHDTKLQIVKPKIRRYIEQKKKV